MSGDVFVREDSDEFDNTYYYPRFGKKQQYTEIEVSFPLPSGVPVNTIDTTYVPVKEERFKEHEIHPVHGVFIAHHEPKATEGWVWIESALISKEKKFKLVTEKADKQPFLDFTIVSISSHGKQRKLSKPAVLRISKRENKFFYDSEEFKLSGKGDTYRDAINEFASTIFATPEMEEKKKFKPSGLWDLLEVLTGTIEGPKDLSVEHDHYLYGSTKRTKK